MKGRVHSYPANGMQTFAIAAELRSFQKTAEALGISPSAVTYRISRIEAYLGRKLFIRHNRSVELTQAGISLARAAEAGFREFGKAFDGLNGDGGGNRLAVSVGRSISTLWLAPRFSGFADAYPGMDIDLYWSDEHVSMTHDDFDVELVPLGPEPREADRYYEPLLDEYSLPVTSPELFDRSAGEAGLEFLASSNVIQDVSEFRLGFATWKTWLNAAGFYGVDPMRGLQVSNSDIAVGAALHGCGITLARVSQVLHYLQSGALCAPFSLTIRTPSVFYFICRKEQLRMRNVRLFLAWLREESVGHNRAIADYLRENRIEIAGDYSGGADHG